MDTDSRSPVTITMSIGGVPVRDIRPVYEFQAFTSAVDRGLVGFRFQVGRSLAPYIGADAPITFAVNGQSLPVEYDDLHTSAKAALPLDHLIAKLDEGWSVSKKGELLARIDANLEWQNDIFEFYESARAKFRQLFGKDLYISYGTLLGQVRSGNFLKSDDDFDTAYLSEKTDLQEVGREFGHIIRTLKEAGENVRFRYRAVLLKWKSPTGLELDIFPSWLDGEMFFMSFGVGSPIAAEIREGFAERDFLGRQVLAPVNSEALLAATYGPNWRTPDPLWQWVKPANVRRALDVIRVEAARVLGERHQDVVAQDVEEHQPA